MATHRQPKDLAEASIPMDAAWVHPRLESGSSGRPELVFTNASFLIAGEKL
jgi:hypothetical protein